MPTSTPPRPTRGAAHSTPPSAASSDADLEGGRRASLYSLISQSLQGCNRREQEEGASSRSGIPQRMRHHSAEHSNDTNTEDLSSLENSLSPWEEWFICKEKELRARFQAQAMEAMHKEMEKIKEDEEREKKKIIAAEKHKEWVQRKNEEVKREKRERERKLSKEMAEKAAKELKKAQSKEKAREVYLEWLKKKNTEEVQKKKDEKVCLIPVCHFKKK
uniref:Coiled-coil domain containing 34 n=1 Tax=Anolis carolinensis TaxID=28377 RepID=A0A803SQU6_ANOCA